jgi:hypothetical protein
VFVLYTSWYSLFAIPRIYANATEAGLFIMGFYYFLVKYLFVCCIGHIYREKNPGAEWISRLATTINFVSRSTSITAWAFIYVGQPHPN